MVRPFQLILVVVLLCAGILSEAGSAWAIQVANKSELKIAAAILRVQGEQKNLLFVKILQPGATLDFTPEQSGPYLVSVKIFDTDETLRMKKVAADAVIHYENGKLKRLKK